MKAYLDIETSYSSDITVIGIFYADGRVRQLIGNKITCENLLESLNGIETIITYNGSRFDLPVIRNKLGLDLTTHYTCFDLMYECWEKNLYGGLKRVEAQLGIERASQSIDGWEAMQLWENYVRYHDQQALGILLQYNRDDIMNLVILEKILHE